MGVFNIIEGYLISAHQGQRTRDLRPGFSCQISQFSHDLPLQF